MFHKWKRRLAPALIVVAWAGGLNESQAQEPPPPAKTAVPEHPDPIPDVKLLPELKTTPVRKGSLGSTSKWCATSLLPRATRKESGCSISHSNPCG